MKKAKKVISIFFIFASFFSYAYAADMLPYAEYLADNDVIVRQRPTQNYGVDDPVLRQEVLGIALRLTQMRFRGVPVIDLPPSYSCENIFTDVGKEKPNTWACRTVEIAAKNGIISRGNPRFRPEETVTRAEALAILLATVKHITPVPEGQSWTDHVLASAKELDILSPEVMNPNQVIKRGELFELTVRTIQALYSSEVDYINNLSK